MLNVLLCLSIPLIYDLAGASLIHCSKVHAIVSNITTVAYDERQTYSPQFATHVQAQLNLHETACFQVYFPSVNSQEQASPINNVSLNQNSSLIYSFLFQSFQYQHPINSRYTFALPIIDSHCKCDCPGGDDHCSGAYRYTNCSSKTSASAVCVTTYHPHQQSDGCLFPGEAELCCDVTMTPPDTQEWYDMLQLAQPEGFLTLTYMLHRTSGDDDVIVQLASERFTMPSNSGNAFFVEPQQIEIQADVREPVHGMDEGMYFASTNGGELRTNAPSNGPQEYNMDRLGWFRLDQGQWTVKNAGLKFQHIHHAKVGSCMAQQYTDTYEAEFFHTKSTQWSLPGMTVDEYCPWLQKTMYIGNNTRHVTVIPKRVPMLNLNMRFSGNPLVLFGYHQARLGEFAGTIQLDRFSNRYLNITFTDSAGAILGIVRPNDKSQEVDSVFTVHINFTKIAKTTSNHIIALPDDIKADRLICCHPSDQSENAKCRVFRFEAMPLHWFVLPTNKWEAQQGSCADCNQLSINNFLKYLNPKYWLDGISGSSEALAMGVEIGFYVVVGIVMFIVVKRCLVPALRCLMCPNRKQQTTVS